MAAAVRPFTPEDAPHVAALRRRMFRHSRWESAEETAAYFRALFFENPWRDPELPAYVAEEGGRVVGFVGVLPRPLAIHGEPVRAAVTTQLMVAPESRGLLSVQLVKKVFAGPQDLLYADIPNDAARKLWEHCGGYTARIYGLGWTRAVRPAHNALNGLGASAWARGLRLAARPLAAAADAVGARVRSNGAPHPSGEVVAEAMDLRTLSEGHPALAQPRWLYPRYDEEALRWLFEQVGAKWRDWRQHRVVLRDGSGTLLGWFVYLLGGGGTAQVLQLAARTGQHGEVLGHLLRHARSQGAVLVRGRADPHFLEALAAAGCALGYQVAGVVVHSRNPELLATVLRGDALLSGLDGEWWMDF